MQSTYKHIDVGPQVDCVVPTRTVFVQHHKELTSPALLVAALNGARLDAALAPPRSASRSKGQWLPPWHGELGCLLPVTMRLRGAPPLRRLDAMFKIRLGHKV